MLRPVGSLFLGGTLALSAGCAQRRLGMEEPSVWKEVTKAQHWKHMWACYRSPSESRSLKTAAICEE